MASVSSILVVVCDLLISPRSSALLKGEVALVATSAVQSYQGWLDPGSMKPAGQVIGLEWAGSCGEWGSGDG